MDRFQQACDALPDYGIGAQAKVLAMTTLMNLLDRVAFHEITSRDPVRLTADLLEAHRATLEATRASMHYLRPDAAAAVPDDMERKHHGLYNEIWPIYNPEEYEVLSARFSQRLANNNFNAKTLAGKRCLEVGCGGGAFCVAVARAGAAHVTGVDFGEKSIAYAREAASRLGLADRLRFEVMNAYDLKLSDAAFDLVISNGVFHHVHRPQDALKQVRRVIKPDGVFWYFVCGEEGLLFTLFNLAVSVLKGIASPEIVRLLKGYGLITGKINFLSDFMKATYQYRSFKEVQAMLRECGFTRVTRVQGGLKDDIDEDKIKAHPHGVTLFGEGTLRLLVRP